MVRQIRSPLALCRCIRDTAFVVRVTELDNPAAETIRWHYVIIPWTRLSPSERALFGAHGWTWFERGWRRGERS